MSNGSSGLTTTVRLVVQALLSGYDLVLGYLEIQVFARWHTSLDVPFTQELGAFSNHLLSLLMHLEHLCSLCPRMEWLDYQLTAIEGDTENRTGLLACKALAYPPSPTLLTVARL
jgi:hypothetical protein